MANEIENKSSLKLKTCETLIDPLSATTTTTVGSWKGDDDDDDAFEFVPDAGTQSSERGVRKTYVRKSLLHIVKNLLLNLQSSTDSANNDATTTMATWKNRGEWKKFHKRTLFFSFCALPWQRL